jgi:hypothetical protein
MLSGQFLQMRAHQSGQRRIALDRNLPDFPDQIIIQRKRDIHAPIIRETLNMGKLDEGEAFGLAQRFTAAITAYFYQGLQCVRENWRFGNPVERRASRIQPGGAN